MRNSERRDGTALPGQCRHNDRDDVVGPGFAQEEDISLKKIVADYEKASGNKIDLSIIPFAPQRQKIISAMTSGAVPDLFNANPAEIVALYSWDDKLGDVGDVVETQKAQYSETALLCANCYNNVVKARQIYGVPYVSGAFINQSGSHWLKRPASRWRKFQIPGTPTTISSRRCRKSCGPRAHAGCTALDFR